MSTLGKTSTGARVQTLHVKTSRRTEWVDVTLEVNKFVSASGVSSGMCYLFIPHTTAGITINEGYDPEVARDAEAAFDRMVPRDAGHKHLEGNSDSHIKATIAGCSEAVWIENGRLRLGRWQGIFFCEFDGPRNREIHVKIVPDPAS
jgi:secondary thiamine-phosphate synthase enzyme